MQKTCKLCGKTLIYKEYDDGRIEHSVDFEPHFVGYCSNCLIKHCMNIDCKNCDIRKYPNCDYIPIKRKLQGEI